MELFTKSGSVIDSFPYRLRSLYNTLETIEPIWLVTCITRSSNKVRLYSVLVFSLSLSIVGWASRLNSAHCYCVTPHSNGHTARSIRLCDYGTSRLNPLSLFHKHQCVSVLIGHRLCAIVHLEATNPLSLSMTHRRAAHSVFQHYGAQSCLLLCRWVTTSVKFLYFSVVCWLA